MLYYIYPHHQLEQLRSAGFGKEPTLFDHQGESAQETSMDDSLTYVVTA
jgi:hypothetical protein